MTKRTYKAYLKSEKLHTCVEVDVSQSLIRMLTKILQKQYQYIDYFVSILD